MEIVSSTMPLDKVQQLKQKIADLNSSLTEAIPGYESLLFTIHKELREDSEINHLLSEEEIGTILSGLAKRKGIIINEEKVVKAKKLTNSALSKVSVHDL